MARAKEEAKAVKVAEKAAVAKAKEDAKIAKEMAKAVKNATQMVTVGHGGAVVVGQGGATSVVERATVEPVMVETAIATASQQHHEFPDEATPRVPIEHLV